MASNELKKTKPKGNPQAYKNSPFVGNNAIKATEDEITQMWDNALTVYKWDKIDLDSDEQVENRCAEYFEHCRNVAERPTVEGLSVAIGCSVRTLNDWENGVTRSQPGSMRSPIIKKAKGVIQYMLAQMAVGNKIYPNVWIFMGKNWFGMKDEQTFTVAPANNLGDQIPLDDLKKLADQNHKDYIVDVDSKESE